MKKRTDEELHQRLRNIDGKIIEGEARLRVLRSGRQEILDEIKRRTVSSAKVIKFREKP